MASTSRSSGKSKKSSNSETSEMESNSSNSKCNREGSGKRARKDKNQPPDIENSEESDDSPFQKSRSKKKAVSKLESDDEDSSPEPTVFEMIQMKNQAMKISDDTLPELDLSPPSTRHRKTKKYANKTAAESDGGKNFAVSSNVEQSSLPSSSRKRSDKKHKHKRKHRDYDQNKPSHSRDKMDGYDDSDKEESSETEPLSRKDSSSSIQDLQAKHLKKNKKFDPTPNTPQPKHEWNATKAFLSRQYGFPTNYSPDIFRYKCYGSMHMAQRLELMYKMKKHEGCVNALHFNAEGTKLASGSDDLDIVVWDWTVSEPLFEYNSGHRSNVFQAKFMPLSNDSSIVSCARDGQVRIGEISNDGTCKGTRKLAQHKGAAHRLAIQNDSPNTFLSCGEDAVIYKVDLRKGKPDKIATTRGANDKKVPLYSIFINPLKSEEFVVGGRDQFVKVYDSRNVNTCLKNICPKHLVTNEKTNVTSVVYNYNGKEILASYNDEDIYLFDATKSSEEDYVHCYKGHRNSQTVKGVNYFGAKSEYIISGSDCGYIFFWEKESEHIVKYMYGDEGGVVNCLEPNPNMPVLATSGLDDDIKIWVPSCEDSPDLSGLRNLLIQNIKEREEERKHSCPDGFMDQTIWFLMQHLHRAYSRRRAEVGPLMRDSEAESSDSSSESDADNENSEGITRAIQCNQS